MGNLPNFQYDNTHMHKEFVDFLIIGDMSFTLFENKKFESFMQRNLQPYNFI